ncbi:9862_t:CDS:2 [Dentiscutata erythropus]|uniref:9861_t:CDS:1 n=1 Tax=Dentiscutata erythropus TaxID=1348616 RepID=A0A9N8ZWR9_9GLOM|nr:9861_t:CDS:2 [Dentiscutata erythropus]CAG8509822.1 9862_t:CDS:2 [Dentiscutata erythropus]
MTLAPKNGDFSLVYSLSGTPTTPAAGKSYMGNGTSITDYSGFEYALFPYSSNGTTNSCGTSSTVCRLVHYNNYNLPRDHYCILVSNPNNVDYYMTMVYTFGGTEAARRSVDESMSSPKKEIYAREFRRRGDFKDNASIDLNRLNHA